MSIENESIEISTDLSTIDIVGGIKKVHLLDGSHRQYVYLDNAASTPAFCSVQNKVNEALEWYSSVHRGYGYKSLVTTKLYDRAHEIIGTFVGADHNKDVVIFTKNTTEAINILANSTIWEPGDVVISTIMEHHSNDLPWRRKAHVVYIEVNDQGELDLDHFVALLKEHSGKVKLVTVTGASNVTGFTPPIHKIASLAHQFGTLILVDCAQLAPHRKIDMLSHESQEHLDFVCLSAHKMYAPFGSGALIGPKDYFSRFPPDHSGGGTIEIVSKDEVFWADPPERNEAGSPNVIGAVALAQSINTLNQIGMDSLVNHEKALTGYILEKLNNMADVHIYGSLDPKRVEDRLGVISFKIGEMHHGKVSAILGFEGGIGVRNGCFCAHPYILRLLGVASETYREFKEQVIAHDRRNVPGLIRVSFGCYNTIEEIDYFLYWLNRIINGDYCGDYQQERETGAFFPRNFDLRQVTNLVLL